MVTTLLGKIATNWSGDALPTGNALITDGAVISLTTAIKRLVTLTLLVIKTLVPLLSIIPLEQQPSVEVVGSKSEYRMGTMVPTT